MQRKSAAPFDTKGEIVAVAMRLFESKGYEGTSVQTIIDAAGVSKGTFYYYFPSKEELLDHAVEHLTKSVLDSLRPLLQDPKLGAVTKLNRFLAEGKRWRIEHMALIKETTGVLFSDENVILRLKVYRQTAALVGPVLAEIIAQGVHEGVFDTPFPEETAEVILHLGNALGESNARELLRLTENASGVEDMMRRIEYFFTATERLLGTRPGTIERSWREVAEKAVEVFGEE